MNDISEIPVFDTNTIPLMDGASLDVVAIETELGELPHLFADERYESPELDREYHLAQQAATAAAAIGRLPGPREAIHLAVSGRFALWDVVPAALTMAAPAIITDLHVATLGFSKINVESMARLLDAGQIGRLSLIASHYFKGTSPDIYIFGVEQLAARGQRFISIRSHAKLLCMQFSDGRTLTVESSANLRSCKNIEQMTLIGDSGLYQFHTKWMEDLHARAASQKGAT